MLYEVLAMSLVCVVMSWISWGRGYRQGCVDQLAAGAPRIHGTGLGNVELVYIGGREYRATPTGSVEPR